MGSWVLGIPLEIFQADLLILGPGVLSNARQSSSCWIGSLCRGERGVFHCGKQQLLFSVRGHEDSVRNLVLPRQRVANRSTSKQRRTCGCSAASFKFHHYHGMVVGPVSTV